MAPKVSSKQTPAGSQVKKSVSNSSRPQDFLRESFHNRFFDCKVLDHVLTVDSTCKRRLAENPAAHPQQAIDFQSCSAKNLSKIVVKVCWHSCMNSVSRIGPMRTKVTSNPFADLFRGTLELLDYRKLSTANRFFDWLTIQS